MGKDEQLYRIIERKVKKEEHKREKPRSRDGALKKCERLFEEGASSEVLTKLEESLRGQEKYYRYYVQCFLPVLDKTIERSKKISNETKKQVISKITYNSKYCSNSITHNQNDRRNSEDSEAESGYGSDVEDDHKVEISNGTTHNNVRLLKVIKNGNNRKFKKYLKDCTDISSIKDEKGNNILHLIVTQLEKKQKFDFLNTVLNVSKKEELKAQLEKAVNDKNGNDQTPLQALLLSKVTKEKHSFETTPRKILTPLKKLIPHYDNTIVSAIQLLKLGANIDDLQLSKEELQNLKEEQKTYYRNFLEKLAEQGKKSKLKPEIKINIEAKIKEIILRTINTPDSNDNYQLHLAIKNNDKERFEELLQKGADISLKDTDGNNALHLIASFKGEQKVTCLELILGLVKNGTISKDKLGEAINAKNGEGSTPLELALKKKAEKKSIEYLRQGTIFDTATAYDNTTKFCTMLLEIGADPCSLELKDPKFHTKKYYLTLRDLKDYSGTPQKAQEKAKELKEKLEEKYHCKTASKKCQSGIKKLGSGIKKGVSATEEVLSAVGKYINPAERTRELLAITITITVIAMVTFAFFQGQMAIGAAIPIIATAGVICLTLTLGFSGIKKLFEKSTNKAQDTFNDKNLSNSTTEQNQASKNPIDNDQQNLGNDSEDLAAKRQRNQSEYTENPATKISDVSILRQFMNKLDGLIVSVSRVAK